MDNYEVVTLAKNALIAVKCILFGLAILGVIILIVRGDG